jgi:SAM-dependent methyltransferase
MLRDPYAEVMAMSDFERRFGANVQQAEYWNSEAGEKWVEFDAQMDRLLHPMTAQLVERSGISAGHRVLDVGCGAGSSTAHLAEIVGTTGRILGLDISEPLLELARKRCSALRQATFENADAQVHQLEQGAFDLVVSRFGVMFFGDPVAAFSNLRSALSRSGAIHFVCWAPASENPWFSVPLSVAKRHFGEPEPTPPRAPGPLAFSEREYVSEILAAAGFRETEVETIPVTMSSTDPLPQAAQFCLRMGPAARLVKANSPDAATLDAVAADLEADLEQFQTEEGLDFPAKVHYVSARP